MRLGVLGSLVLDTVRMPEQPASREALGGIAYSLAAFEASRPAGWTAFPIIKVGDDLRDRADRCLASLNAIGSREGVWTVPAPNSRVELTYDDGGERTERLSGGVPGWSWEELAPLARSCDALYVNLIAGWEMDLPCARELAGALDGTLYCDLHSALLGVAPDGTRFPREPEDWRDWIGLFDFLQLNEEELRVLAGSRNGEPGSVAEELATGRTDAVLVTLGREGAAWRARDGRSGSAAARDELPVVDPTGCGDVWGMACLCALLEGDSLENSVRRGNRLAGRNAALGDASELARWARRSRRPDEST